MKSSKKMRSVATWLVFGVLGVGACQVVVGETELKEVRCTEGAAYDGACPPGQTCVGGKCVTPGASGSAGTGGTQETGGTGGVTGGTGGDTGGTGGETGGTGGDTGGTGGDTGGTGGDTGGTGGDTGGTGGTATGGTGGTATGGTGGTETGGTGGTETGGTGGTGGTPQPFGELCSASALCEPGLLCLQAEVLGAPRCATLCCGSVDCASDAVCVPTKVGGMGCFPVTLLGRPTPGSGLSSSDCSGHGDCRSASCVGNVCKDVCCKHASCADGRACAWESGTTPGWYCSTSAVGTSGGQGAACDGDGDCDGRNCFKFAYEDSRCMGACCRDADCGSNAFCDYYQDGAEVIRQCFPYVPVIFKPPGPLQACCTNADCPSGKCEVTYQAVYESVATYPILGDPVLAMRCAP